METSKRQCRLIRRWLTASLLCASLGVGLTTPPVTAGSDPGVVWEWGVNNMFGEGAGPELPVIVGGLDGPIAVSGGDAYALALKSDGTVWGWGYNAWGQLGDGTRTTRHTPVQVTGLTAITAVAAGSNYAVALRNDGTVWAWGAPGTTGEGDALHPVDFRLTPVQVPDLTGVTAIAASYASLALKSDGTVWTWNDKRTLLLRLPSMSLAPIQVPGLAGVRAIAAGSGFSLVLKSDGTVWGWGSNHYGQLGDGTAIEREFAGGPCPFGAVQVKGMNGVVAIAAGGDHSLALKSDGTVWAWGQNGAGQLGDGTTIFAGGRPVPAQVSGLGSITGIAAGLGHSLAMNNAGTVWAWGENQLGELGDGRLNRPAHVDVPMPVPGLPSGVTSIAAGSVGNQGFAIIPPTVSPPAAAPASPPVEGPPSPPPAPEPPAVQPVPDTLTDSITADVLAAIDRANAAWANALQTLDTSHLSENLAGQLLTDDLAEVDRLRRQGLAQNNTNTDFAVTDVTMDAPGHALVQTRETWDSAISNATTGQVIQQTPSTTYVETYTVEYLNGGWIVTRDDLAPE